MGYISKVLGRIIQKKKKNRLKLLQVLINIIVTTIMTTIKNTSKVYLPKRQESLLCTDIKKNNNVAFRKKKKMYCQMSGEFLNPMFPNAKPSESDELLQFPAS